MDSQIPVKPSDLACLTNAVSYVDTRNIISFKSSEVNDQLRHKPDRLKGKLSRVILLKIRDAVEKCGQLLPDHESIVRKNFK
jgi:hypothetical protein